MTTVAITGVGGLIGRRLVAQLTAREDITRLIGIDHVLPPGFGSSKLTVRRADVRDPGLDVALQDAEVLIHLAFQVDPLHDEAAMWAVNVAGTRNVCSAAARAGVRHLVYLSSVVAYGAHPDNDVPLTEDAPLRGTPGFNYAEHKAEVEAWLASWSPTTDLDVTVLRVAPVLGPGVHNVVSRLFESPRLPVIKGHRPPLQFVHVDDVVTAIVHVVDGRLTGAYNVAAPGWLSLDEVTAIVGRRTVEVPEEVAVSGAAQLWRLGLGDQPPGLVQHLMHPFVVDPGRLLATGWQPVWSNRDALDAFAAEHRRYLALGPLRTTRTVAAGTTAVAVLALAGVLGLAGRELLKHHRRHRARRRARRAERTGRTEPTPRTEHAAASPPTVG